MRIFVTLCLVVAATFLVSYGWRKGMIAYLQPGATRAVKERASEDRERSLQRTRERDFDLAEELEISTEQAEQVYAFEVDAFIALNNRMNPPLPEEELRKQLREQEAKFAEMFGPVLAYRHKAFKKEYTSRAELQDLRERLAKTGVTLSYPEAKALLQCVKPEYTTSVQYLRYAKSAEDFRSLVEVQVDYNRNIITRAVSVLNGKQCSSLTLVLRRRLGTEYQESLEYLQKTKPGFTLSGGPLSLE